VSQREPTVNPPPGSSGEPRLQLSVLGHLDLRTSRGAEQRAVLGQPKRLALLLYLVLSPRGTLRRRDQVAALLWPEDDEEHARGSLRQAVRFLRRELGHDVVVSRGDEEIGIDAAHLGCDAVAFEAAVASRDIERGVALYRGDLLPGFHVDGVAADFEEWLDQYRARLRRAASALLGELAERRFASGQQTDAIACAHRAVELSRDDEGAHRRLIALLDQAGDRAGAIAAYEALARRLRTEYAALPSAETQALIRRVRGRDALHQPGDARDSHSPPPPPSEVGHPPRPARRVPAIGFAALLLAALVVLRLFFWPSAAAVGIAVLPVQSLGGDSTQAPLAEGMTDELITDLAQISRLRVINRRTMMTYQGTRLPPDRIAARLGVQWILSGTMQLQGDEVVYRVQLVRAGDAGAAGAVTFTGTRDQVLEWQRDVARRVAEWTRISLVPAERIGLAPRRRVDPQALDLYARGRWWWNRRGRENLARADQLFHQALDFEPTYAPIWSGRADTYAQIGYGGFLPPDEAFKKAKAMARRALELDSTLAEPHAALGFSMMYLDWDWAGAEREFQTAIRLNPSYATAHEWYGLFLAAMGRFRQAEEEGRLAQALDPLSAAVAATLGWILHYAGKQEEALRVLRAGVRSDSTNGVVQLYLGRVHQYMGQFDSATAHYEATGALRAWIPTVAGEGTVAARIGRQAEARGVLHRLDSLRTQGEYVTPYAEALVYAALGESDSAFSRLDRALQDRTHWLVWLNRDSRWKEVRADPRFDRLVRAVGLPP
jgi:DNA-binding SARP family transcriptional activator/TolB-like protein/Tfp pilus assembly protein PilF